MAIYRATIIGLGAMGTRMLRNMIQHPRFELAGVWDPSVDALNRVSDDFPDIPVNDDPTKQSGLDEPDLVYVACPPLWHKEYALAAIAASKPLYCEKPLGIDVAESRDLVHRLKASGTPNVVNFAQASGEAVTRTVGAMKAGKLGTISGVEIILHFSQWPREWQAAADWLRFRDQGGYVREVLSHFIYLSERLFGPARLVFSHPTYPDDPALCETHIHAMLDCAGLPVSVHGGTGGAGPDRIEMTIYGSQRSHRIVNFYELETSDGGPWTAALAADPDRRNSAVQEQLDNVARWLDGAPHTMPSAAAALSVQELVEAMLAG